MKKTNTQKAVESEIRAYVWHCIKGYKIPSGLLEDQKEAQAAALHDVRKIFFESAMPAEPNFAQLRRWLDSEIWACMGIREQLYGYDSTYHKEYRWFIGGLQGWLDTIGK